MNNTSCYFYNGLYCNFIEKLLAKTSIKAYKNSSKRNLYTDYNEHSLGYSNISIGYFWYDRGGNVIGDDIGKINIVYQVRNKNTSVADDGDGEDEPTNSVVSKIDTFPCTADYFPNFENVDRIDKYTWVDIHKYSLVGTKSASFSKQIRLTLLFGWIKNFKK